ncbi:MAG TPA: hypothetical protein VLZ77_17555 [Acidimicrobiales bacterium]|nr:hypothetical protein [Acidimicrobiales bacterium]
MPLAGAVLVVITGMAFCLLWSPLVDHHSGWIVPGDIWGAYRSAHFIGWGDLGGIYAAGTALITFPAILLALAPVSIVTGFFGMSESIPFNLPHPSSWLVLGPVEILLSCSALFACDALAERLGIGMARRTVLGLAEGVVVWDVSAYWGHPEDAVAVALALYAFLFAWDGRWCGAAWLFGLGVATQPVVLLMLPVYFVMADRRSLVPFMVRVLVPSVALLAVPLLAEFHTTVHSLVDQPNFPNIDHLTPWTRFAPRLGGSGKDMAVAAGPGRIVAISAAAALGWTARRWRARPDALVWVAAVALALRCLTESVMVSFYVWPALAVGLLAVMIQPSRLRVAGAVVVTVIVTFGSNSHLSEWPWWLLVNGGIVILLVAGVPSRVPQFVPIDIGTGDVPEARAELEALTGAPV